MNNIIISVFAFFGSVGALIMLLYTFILHIKMKKMQGKNQVFSSYVKDNSFLLMKNGGDNPCDTQKKFIIPAFSQESDYIVGR